MKAIVQDRYGGPDVLEFRDVDQPVPTDDEVLVRVHAAGLHRGDWHVMTGLPYLVRVVVPTLGMRKPKVAVRGMDVAGRVEAVGAQVARFRPGDEVFGWCDGAFAEDACAPEDHLAARPAALSFEEAAVVPSSGFAALHAVRDVGEVQPGQQVLVIGAAGAVGWFAVQLAKAFGAQVTGVASTTQVELVRSVGADEVVDYTKEDVTDGTRQWDVIVDTGGRRSLSQLRRAFTPSGTLVIVGGEGGGRWLGGFLRNLRAPLVSRLVGQRLRMLVSKERPEDLEALRELLEAGKLTPRIGRSYPLARLPRPCGRWRLATPAARSSSPFEDHRARLTSSTPRATVNQMVRYSTLDRTFSALSDPTRRHILERLERGPATISELAQPFGITLPGLLKHVRILEEADLVITEKRGRTRQCRLGSEHLDDAARWIQTYQRRWEGRLDRLGGYLEKKRGARR